MDIRYYQEPLFQQVDEASLKPFCDLGQGTHSFVSLEIHPGLGFYAKKTSSLQFKKNLRKDLEIMVYFHNHPRIVQALSSRLYLLPKDCYIYMEYASEGTLRDIISAKPMPENAIGSITRMILQGLEALHSCGYVHRNLKPSNVLLFPSTAIGEPWNVKIADFGLSMEPNGDASLLYRGTEQYMPPEADKLIAPALDIWSLGCLVFEMFGGKPVKMEECYVWRLYQDISPVAIDFLRRCHAWDPFCRATADKLLRHPFINQRVSVQQPNQSHISQARLDEMELERISMERRLSFISEVDWSDQKTAQSW